MTFREFEVVMVRNIIIQRLLHDFINRRQKMICPIELPRSQARSSGFRIEHEIDWAQARCWTFPCSIARATHRPLPFFLRFSDTIETPGYEAVNWNYEKIAYNGEYDRKCEKGYVIDYEGTREKLKVLSRFNLFVHSNVHVGRALTASILSFKMCRKLGILSWSNCIQVPNLWLKFFRVLLSSTK